MAAQDGVVQKLTTHSGHWVWVRDDPSWDKHVKKVWGAHYDLGRALLSAETVRPHQWFTNGGGNQVNHTVVNALTGPNGHTTLKDYSGEGSNRPFKLPNGEIMHTLERVNVVGDVLRAETTGGPTETGQRKHEVVTFRVTEPPNENQKMAENDEYELAMEDKIVGDGVVGKRYFRRYPCYFIHNDTDQKVKLYLYNSSDFLYLIAAATHEVDYGGQYIDATSFETQEEQACFERDDGARYWVTLKPFCACITLDKETFERGGSSLPICSSKRCS